MLTKIKSKGPFLWLKKQLDERKRRIELKKVAKQEKLWDMRLRGQR